MDYKLDWKGEEVVKQIEKLSEEKMKDFVENITELAKDKSPVLTGHNKSTITWEKKDKVFRIFGQSGYSGYLELGTAKMKAQPYIFPAYEQSLDEFKKDLEDSV